MTLEQLRIFVAVAETLSMTRAAGRLHLSQPAVSAAVAALELRHTTRLFDRVGRRLELTEAGRLFVPEARDVYPEPSQFGVLPAHGLYVRHARGLKVDGLTIVTDLPDARPPMVLEDAERVAMKRVRITGDPVLRQTQDVTIRRA